MISNIKYFFNKFFFIRAFFGPFLRPKLKFYFGKIAIGTPIFYPRRWVKCKDKKGYRKPVPRKFGFDIVGLGWKTKWSDTDYRFEWSPIISFVFIKWQFCVMVIAPHVDHYWESWLYYQYNTDKKKSRGERIKDMRKEHPQIWITYNEDDEEETIDYYDLILKKKYR